MIYYLVADHPAPSWGTGMLYEHVRLLRELGRDACVLHHQSPYRPAWRELEVPVKYLDEPGFAVAASDVVVVPEVLAASDAVRWHPWRRVVFVQGSFLIVRGMGGSVDYPALGYEAAMAVLPHVARIVERHFGLPAEVVPPFIAPYFFDTDSAPRQRRVLLAVKEGYRLAGIPDEEIAGALLAKELARRPGWALVPLTGLTHREVAKLMRTSLFLVNVNSLEAFNTTVPEAMAAGCIPVCYEAVGGRDFLRDGENAVVFTNHEAYALVERVCELVDGFEEHGELLERLRAGGRKTAASFRPEVTAQALARFFSSGLQCPPSGFNRLASPSPHSATPLPSRRNIVSRMQLNADPRALREQYFSALPFPHIVIDNLFPDEVLKSALAEFPKPDEIEWRRFDNPTEKKLGYWHESTLRPNLQLFLYEMNSAPVLRFLEALTGIEGLIPDPYYGGAGPHQILPGGFLKVHVDFNWHPLLKLDRRLNLLVYLNEDWKEEYGGHLELWDREMTRCVQRILPVFNRTVVFSTTDFSFHGHPTPLACPDGMSRKSLSFYYYTNGRPDEERSAPHDTIFRKTHDHDW